MTGAADQIARGNRVALRHLRDADFPALHRIAMSLDVRRSWRSRGAYWSPAELQHRVAADPFLAMVVTDLDDGPPLGLVELHDVDLLDRRAQLGIVTEPASWGSPTAAEAAVLFLRHAFATLPLDKVACSVQATNVRAVRALRRLFAHEGTLRRHLNLDGTWVDLEVFAIWRSDLSAVERRLGLELEDAPTEPAGSPVIHLAHRAERAEEDAEDLLAEVEAVLAQAGHEPADLDHLTFGDVDSLAVAELVLIVEASLGHRLAIEAFDLSTPLRDLLVIALGEDVGDPQRGPRRIGGGSPT